MDATAPNAPHVGAEPEEREMWLAFLKEPLGWKDVFQRRAFRSFQAELGEERHEEYWMEPAAEIAGTLIVLDARRLDHAQISVRFVATDTAPKRGPSQPFWLLTGYLGRTQAGDEAVTHLAFECEPDWQLAVSSDVLRSFKPAEIIAKTNATLATADRRADLRAAWDVPDVETLRDLEQAAREARAMELRRGRGGFPDRYYRGLAFDYLKQRKLGRGALKRLATMYGREVKTIRDHLNRASAHDFLEGGRSGRPYRAGPRLYA